MLSKVVLNLIARRKMKEMTFCWGLNQQNDKTKLNITWDTTEIVIHMFE